MSRLTALPLAIAVVLALSVPAIAGPVLMSGSATVNASQTHGGPHGGFVFKSTMSPPAPHPVVSARLVSQPRPPQKQQSPWQPTPSQRIVRCGGHVYTGAQAMRAIGTDALRCLTPKPPFAVF